MNNVYLLIVAVAGAGIAVQLLINTQLRVTSGSALWSSAAQFLLGFAGLIVASLVAREPLPSPATLARGPWWMWLGGLLGAVYILVSVLMSRRLGATVLLAATVVGQLVMALLIDHYGWLGAPVIRLSTSRVLGVALVVFGVIVMRWR